jgi:hypothetical protein
MAAHSAIEHLISYFCLAAPACSCCPIMVEARRAWIICELGEVVIVPIMAATEGIASKPVTAPLAVPSLGVERKRPRL